MSKPRAKAKPAEKAPWAAWDVEPRPIDSLIPYARNARTHSDAQVAEIAASIREFGWTIPVLVSEDGTLIAGHGRIMAARLLGITEVPAMVARGWSETQRRAYCLLDNRVPMNAGWDMEMLAAEVRSIDADLDAGLADFDLSILGFDTPELAEMLDAMLSADKTERLTDPDEVPETPERPVTVLGDVWVLGKHRIVCGDSTSPDVIDKLMSGKRADLLFTSPPYAQQRDYGAAKESVSDWDALMQGVFSVAPVKDGAQVLVNLGLVHRDGEWIPYWDQWISWMRAAGWRRFGWYIWDQGPGLPGDWNGRLAPSHEFIFHFNRDAMRANKTVASKHAGKTLGGGGLRNADGVVKRKTGHGNAIQPMKIADSVFRVMRHKGGLGKAGKHPAVFPVALVEEALAAYSKEGDVVFEPFCGSGTQVIAAEKLARHCFAIDIDPAYVDVAVRRWQYFTGQQATLKGDGRTFADVSGERVAEAA